MGMDLKIEAFAAVLGIDPHMFAQRINKERNIQGSIIPKFASVLGVDSKVFKEAKLAEAPEIPTRLTLRFSRLVLQVKNFQVLPHPIYARASVQSCT